MQLHTRRVLCLAAIASRARLDYLEFRRLRDDASTSVDRERFARTPQQLTTMRCNMIKPTTHGLSSVEHEVLMTIRGTWYSFGSMPETKEIADLSGLLVSECFLAIHNLCDRGFLVRLPDGGLAPRNSF